MQEECRYCILHTIYEEAQDFCDRIGILSEGQLIKEDTPENLIKEVQAFNLEEAFIQVTNKASEGLQLGM